MIPLSYILDNSSKVPSAKEQTFTNHPQAYCNIWNACYPRHLYILRSVNKCRRNWKHFWLACHIPYWYTHRGPRRAQKQQRLPCGSFHGIFSSVGDCQMWPSEARLACPCYKMIWSVWRLQKERKRKGNCQIVLQALLRLSTIQYKHPAQETFMSNTEMFAWSLHQIWQLVNLLKSEAWRKEVVQGQGCILREA